MQIVEDYRDETDERKKPVTTQTLPFHKLLSQADAIDWILMALGTLGSIVHGIAQPVGYMLLGKALNAYGNNTNNTDDMVEALNKVYYMTLNTKISCAVIRKIK